jgi:YD repeat-containing protein
MSFGVDVSTASLKKVAIFSEPLLPTSTPSADDNRAVAALIESIAGMAMSHRLIRIEQFLEAHPASPWRASLLANAATIFAKNGYFTRAAGYWNQAWEMTRDSADAGARAIADYSLGESMGQMAMFGQVERLEQRLKEIDGRDVRGTAGAKVNSAAAGLRFLREHHELALFSGPEALKALLRITTNTPDSMVRKINDYHPTPAGTSMVDLRGLAASTGVRMRLVHSAPLSDIPVPSIVHLRSQHFSAVTAKQGDSYTLSDPGLGGSFRITAAALRDEASGYFLVPETAPVDAMWREVADSEASNVLGHCSPGGPSGYDPPCPNCGGGGPGPGGMPSYSFHPVNASLILEDVPVGYAPPVGPPVSLVLSYNHRDARQPQTPNYGNVGPLWSMNSLSFVVDNIYCIVSPCTEAAVILRGHGQEGYAAVPSTHVLSRATLSKLSDDPPHYRRTLADGTVEVFTQPDRAATEYGRLILMTQVIDPQGHTLTYTYDSSLRVVAITDAIGQVSTLEYTNANPLLLTKMIDPFGRFATIGYDGIGRITSITDAANMTSTFTYGTGDFITAMTTPYGTTSFRHEGTAAWFDPAIEAIDPVGGPSGSSSTTSD